MKLFWEQGYGRTSLAQIADEACVQLGNVYYYFKTKDEIGAAVVQYLSAQNRTMQEMWNAREPDPTARLCAFFQLILDSAPGLMQCGCPVAGICSELRKAKTKSVAEQAAAVFVDMQIWMEEQFGILGKEREAQELATHLLTLIQGSILLSHVFHDAAYLENEMRRLQSWVRGL